MADLAERPGEGNGSPPLTPGAGLPLVPGAPGSILDSPPRAPAFLGSRKNLVGAGLAMLGVVVAFTGLAGPFWPLLVVGLYVAGVMITPNARVHTLRTGNEMGDVRRALNAQVQSMSGRVPAEVARRVANIQNMILALLPRAEQLPAGSEDIYILRATALEYLPAALGAYLDLPREYATRRLVEGRRTPEVVLTDQLALLETKMAEISEDIAGNDSDRLLANGRFLREKFGRRELQVPREESPPAG